eukprot:scaffold13918_cov132-Amphora_coffeaeformis.AAC.1
MTDDPCDRFLKTARASRSLFAILNLHQSTALGRHAPTLFGSTFRLSKWHLFLHGSPPHKFRVAPLSKWLRTKWFLVNVSAL